MNLLCLSQSSHGPLRHRFTSCVWLLVIVAILTISPGLPASAQEAGAADRTPADIGATLPRNLSPWGMFVDADWVVKAVMIGLVLASVLTWTIWLVKTFELRSLGHVYRRDLGALTSARGLGEVSELPDGTGRDLVQAGEAELALSSDAPDKDGIKERIASSLGRLEAASARRMTTGTGILATVGATAPFIGLFGTVWGIMNSFIGISEARTTNLAVVAPGIAEALLATALGLVAAVPAVIIYNHFARRIAATKALVADMTAAVLRLVSRDLDRGLEPPAAKLEAVGSE